MIHQKSNSRSYLKTRNQEGEKTSQQNNNSRVEKVVNMRRPSQPKKESALEKSLSDSRMQLRHQMTLNGIIKANPSAAQGMNRDVNQFSQPAFKSQHTTQQRQKYVGRGTSSRKQAHGQKHSPLSRVPSNSSYIQNQKIMRVVQDKNTPGLTKLNNISSSPLNNNQRLKSSINNSAVDLQNNMQKSVSKPDLNQDEIIDKLKSRLSSSQAILNASQMQYNRNYSYGQIGSHNMDKSYLKHTSSSKQKVSDKSALSNFQTFDEVEYPQIIKQPVVKSNSNSRSKVNFRLNLNFLESQNFDNFQQKVKQITKTETISKSMGKNNYQLKNSTVMNIQNLVPSIDKTKKADIVEDPSKMFSHAKVNEMANNYVKTVESYKQKKRMNFQNISVISDSKMTPRQRVSQTRVSNHIKIVKQVTPQKSVMQSQNNKKKQMQSAGRNSISNQNYINNSHCMKATPVKLEMKKNSHNKSVVTTEKGNAHQNQPKIMNNETLNKHKIINLESLQKQKLQQDKIAIIERKTRFIHDRLGAVIIGYKVRRIFNNSTVIKKLRCEFRDIIQFAYQLKLELTQLQQHRKPDTKQVYNANRLLMQTLKDVIHKREAFVTHFYKLFSVADIKGDRRSKSQRRLSNSPVIHTPTQNQSSLIEFQSAVQKRIQWLKESQPRFVRTSFQESYSDAQEIQKSVQENLIELKLNQTPKGKKKGKSKQSKSKSIYRQQFINASRENLQFKQSKDFASPNQSISILPNTNYNSEFSSTLNIKKVVVSPFATNPEKLMNSELQHSGHFLKEDLMKQSATALNLNQSLINQMPKHKEVKEFNVEQSPYQNYIGQGKKASPLKHSSVKSTRKVESPMKSISPSKEQFVSSEKDEAHKQTMSFGINKVQSVQQSIINMQNTIAKVQENHEKMQRSESNINANDQSRSMSLAERRDNLKFNKSQISFRDIQKPAEHQDIQTQMKTPIKFNRNRDLTPNSGDYQSPYRYVPSSQSRNASRSISKNFQKANIEKIKQMQLLQKSKLQGRNSSFNNSGKLSAVSQTYLTTEPIEKQNDIYSKRLSYIKPQDSNSNENPEFIQAEMQSKINSEHIQEDKFCLTSTQSKLKLLLNIKPKMKKQLNDQQHEQSQAYNEQTAEVQNQDEHHLENESSCQQLIILPKPYSQSNNMDQSYQSISTNIENKAKIIQNQANMTIVSKKSNQSVNNRYHQKRFSNSSEMSQLQQDESYRSNMSNREGTHGQSYQLEDQQIRPSSSPSPQRDHLPTPIKQSVLGNELLRQINLVSPNQRKISNRQRSQSPSPSPSPNTKLERYIANLSPIKNGDFQNRYIVRRKSAGTPNANLRQPAQDNCYSTALYTQKQDHYSINDTKSQSIRERSSSKQQSAREFKICMKSIEANLSKKNIENEYKNPYVLSSKAKEPLQIKLNDQSAKSTIIECQQSPDHFIKLIGKNDDESFNQCIAMISITKAEQFTFSDIDLIKQGEGYRDCTYRDSQRIYQDSLGTALFNGNNLNKIESQVTSIDVANNLYGSVKMFDQSKKCLDLAQSSNFDTTSNSVAISQKACELINQIKCLDQSDVYEINASLNMVADVLSSFKISPQKINERADPPTVNNVSPKSQFQKTQRSKESPVKSARLNPCSDSPIKGRKLDKSQSPIKKLDKTYSTVKEQAQQRLKSTHKKSNISVSTSPKKKMKSSPNKENEIYPQQMVNIKNFGRLSIDMDAVILNETNEAQQIENKQIIDSAQQRRRSRSYRKINSSKISKKTPCLARPTDKQSTYTIGGVKNSQNVVIPMKTKINNYIIPCSLATSTTLNQERQKSQNASQPTLAVTSQKTEHLNKATPQKSRRQTRRYHLN